jgi:hypothetical protein
MEGKKGEEEIRISSYQKGEREREVWKDMEDRE